MLYSLVFWLATPVFSHHPPATPVFSHHPPATPVFSHHPKSEDIWVDTPWQGTFPYGQGQWKEAWTPSHPSVPLGPLAGDNSRHSSIEWVYPSNERDNPTSEWNNPRNEWDNLRNEWYNPRNGWNHLRNERDNPSNEWDNLRNEFVNPSNEWITRSNWPLSQTDSVPEVFIETGLVTDSDSLEITNDNFEDPIILEYDEEVPDLSLDELHAMDDVVKTSLSIAEGLKDNNIMHLQLQRFSDIDKKNKEVPINNKDLVKNETVPKPVSKVNNQRQKRYPSHLNPLLMNYNYLRRDECPPSEVGVRNFFCPTPDPSDGSWKCVDAEDICNKVNDCPGKEDESPEHCMFHKIMKAQMETLKDQMTQIAKILEIRKYYYNKNNKNNKNNKKYKLKKVTQHKYNKYNYHPSFEEYTRSAKPSRFERPQDIASFQRRRMKGKPN